MIYKKNMQTHRCSLFPSMEVTSSKAETVDEKAIYFHCNSAVIKFVDVMLVLSSSSLGSTEASSPWGGGAAPRIANHKHDASIPSEHARFAAGQPPAFHQPSAFCLLPKKEGARQFRLALEVFLTLTERGHLTTGQLARRP